MNNFSVRSEHRLPPGKMGLPFIGETFTFLREPDFAIKRFEQYGPVYKTHLMGRPTVVLAGAEANEFILNSGMDHLAWASGWPNTFKELLGRSLFVQDGDEHRQKRKLIAPAFHGRALASYVEMMDLIIQKYLALWEEKREFAWFTEFKKMTFEIAAVLLIGADPGEDTAVLSQKFSELTTGFFTLPVNMPGTPYAKALKARDYILDYIGQQIANRKSNPQNDALSMLILSEDEDGNKLSDQEIEAQALLLLFAGHETTTSLLTSFCMELGRNPEVCGQARAEQAYINTFTEPDMKLLRQMPYLDQVLQEVERLHPPVISGFRGVEESFEFNGYTIPKGWQVLYSIIATHHDPEIYPDPLVFNPDRWHPKNRKDRSSFSLVGFGGGPRTCIGKAFANLEIKLVATHLLRNYRWQLLLDQDLSLNYIPTTHPQDFLRVKFSRRKSIYKSPVTAVTA